MHNIKLDIPDITVVIEKGSEYLSTVTPSEVYQVLVNTGDNYNVVVDNHDIIVTNNSGSYLTVADYASTASYALIAQSLAAGAAIIYDTISASNAYFGNLTVSQSITANLFTGSFVGNLVGTSSWASNAVSSSFALTASYVSGGASTWDTITNKPSGLVSSSTQVLNYNIFATTGSNLFNGNQTITGSLNVSGTLNIGGNVSTQTSETTGNTLEGGGVFVNKRTNAFQYSPYNGGPYLSLDIEYQKPLTREIGINTLAIGFADLTVQTTAFVPTTYATTGSNSFNGNQTITGSLIQGLEGNIATGENSHAEGSITKAIGNYSHAEGDNTQAKGDYSHAEGQETIASGSYSHAEGYQTIALGNHQHVQGQYNAVSSVPAAFIVGNGTDDSNRSNLIYAAGNEVQITGSLNVTNGITGSLYGTASRALTASFIDGGFY